MVWIVYGLKVVCGPDRSGKLLAWPCTAGWSRLIHWWVTMECTSCCL